MSGAVDFQEIALYGGQGRGQLDVEVVDGIKKAIPRIEKIVPPGVRVEQALAGEI